MKCVTTNRPNQSKLTLHWKHTSLNMAAKMKRIGNDTELDRLLNRDFVCEGRTGYVEVGDDKFCLPVYYEDWEEKLRKFEVKNDDVFLVAHPKTGTTWLQEMLWLIVNDLDYEGAKREMLFRSPQLELTALYDKEKLFDPYFFEPLALVEDTPSPRIIKSHLHWSLLPEQIRNGSKNPKVVCILRNAEDTCVSLYHHSKTVDGYKGTFEDFCKLFLGGRVCFGPFWKQVLSCWEQRDKPNVLFLKYKEMKDDLASIIKRVAEFLNKTITEEQVDSLAKHLSFDSMKKNKAVNVKREGEPLQRLQDIGLNTEDSEFIRSGKVGGYKEVMTPDMIEKFRVWTEENLRGTGLSKE